MSPERTTPLDSTSLAAESHKGADDAAALPVRLDRYSRAHHRALDMSDYAAKAGYVKESRSLSKCGHWLLFRDYYNVGKVRLHAADFCQRHLLCPLCAIRRGAKLVSAYLEKLLVVREEHPGLHAYLVTLTVKNGPDLYERFRHLTRSQKKMTQARRSHLRGKGPHVEMAKAVGFVGSYEFKRGKGSSEWHPHSHQVWLCHEAPDAQKLSDEWRSVTGDSYIVDVRPFTDQDDVTDGFLEVFKYAVKFSDLPLADNWHGYEVLKGRRLVFSGGAFYGVEVPESLEDEPLDDQPFNELLYRFAKGSGYSLVTDHHSLAAEPERRGPRSRGGADRASASRLGVGPLQVLGRNDHFGQHGRQAIRSTPLSSNASFCRLAEGLAFDLADDERPPRPTGRPVMPSMSLPPNSPPC